MVRRVCVLSAWIGLLAGATGCALYIQDLPRHPNQATIDDIKQKAGPASVDLLDDCHDEMSGAHSKAKSQRLASASITLAGGIIGIASGLYAAVATPEVNAGTNPPEVDDKSRKIAAYFAAGGAVVALIGAVLGAPGETNRRYDASVTAWYAAVSAYQNQKYAQMNQLFQVCKTGNATAPQFAANDDPVVELIARLASFEHKCFYELDVNSCNDYKRAADRRCSTGDQHACQTSHYADEVEILVGQQHQLSCPGADEVSVQRCRDLDARIQQLRVAVNPSVSTAPPSARF